MEDKSYRHKASFGKRIEHYLIGQMLKEGLDVYIPMIDDDGEDVAVWMDIDDFKSGKNILYPEEIFKYL